MTEMMTPRPGGRRAKAEGLGIGETAIRRLIKTGELHTTRVGNRDYFAWSELLRVLGVEQQQRKEA